MAPFSTECFLRDIKHADKDLRLMALFDLRRCLPSADENGITSDVVNKVLLCLSPEERCEEVQNEAANVLPEMVVKCSQRDVIFQFLLSSITERCILNDSDDTNLQYLSGMTFKNCCLEFASEARRSVAFWQKQIDMVRHLCVGCATQLEIDGLQDTAREILYTAVNTLVPAYKEALGERDVLIKRAVRDFQKTNSIRHASLTLIESLLALVRAATQESVVAESLKLLVTATSSEEYVAYLQLCEVEMRALRSPPMPVVQQVIDSACEHLAHVTKQNDEGDDSTEMLLEVVCSLVQIHSSGKASSWRGTFAAVKDLVTFDSYASGTEEDAYANDVGYDDDYDEYYINDNGTSNSSWKLRMWTIRVLQALVAQHDDKELGMQSLSVAATTLQDHVQAVQLEAVKLVRTVASRSYVHDADCVALITSCCHRLCNLIGGEDDKATMSLIKALVDIFESLADAPSFCESTVPLLLNQVRAHFSTVAASAAAVEGCRCIVESVIQARGDGESLSSETVSLAKELSALCLCGGNLSAMAACITKASDTLAQVYKATRDACVSTVLGNNYGALLENRSFPAACRAAAAESLASWAAAQGLSTLEKPAAALWRALDCDEVKLPVLRALSIMASSSESSASVPTSVLEKVAALAESGSASVRAASVDVLLRRLTAPNTPPLAAPFLQHLMTLFAPGHPLSLSSCELAEVSSLALLIAQLFQHRTEKAVPFYGTYFVGLWEHVARMADAVLWSRSLMNPALNSLTELVGTVYEHESESRLTIEDGVRQFLVSNQSHIPCICMVVRCVSAGSASAVSAFLRTISPQLVERAHLLLCVGEAGQATGLGADWSALVLDSVQSKEGELVRSCGERSLSLCMLHPGNTESILMPCGERAADGGTAGRYYYVKSIKEAATLALSRHRTAFHDAAVSKPLLFLFLQSSVGADLVELYGACTGLLSVFLFDAERSLMIADALFETEASLDTRVTCMVALRYFLSALAERSANVEIYRPTVLRALLQLHRPTDTKESTEPSLLLRSMALRLLTTVLQHSPHWLLCEATRTSIFPNLLTELREDAKLQGTFDLSGYTHRVDRGLECRKLAFESLSAVFRAARHHNVDLVEYCEAEKSVVSMLIMACSSHGSGDRESSINDTAKDLLVRFVESKPEFVFTPPQLDSLVAKLSHDIKWGASLTDSPKTTLLYTIKCLMKLSSQPVFMNHEGFQEVAEVARKSPLLAQSLKL
ncbi:TATA-binding protein interacting (TIP20), putative [Leishmania guyanensis]